MARPPSRAFEEVERVGGDASRLERGRCGLDTTLNPEP